MGGGSGFFTFQDRNPKERATFSFKVGPVTAANLAGDGGVLDRVGTLKDAVNAITLGFIVAEGLSVYNNRIAPTTGLGKEVQREKKWLVTYADNTEFFDVLEAVPNEAFGRIFNAEIPTADLSLLPSSSLDDFADIITAGPMATFVTEFEATCKSPAGGTPKVLSIEYVGRNL
jgi:hypothetical protein